MFHPQQRTKTYGKVVGFTFSFFLFTTIVFFMLSLFKKIPPTWHYEHIALGLLFVLSLGWLLRKIL
ncbi:hypothetical protein CL622_08320 [archaeon]|nr:hypothetical protein [archaeon]